MIVNRARQAYTSADSMFVNPNIPSLESPAQLARQAAQRALQTKLAHEKKEAALKAAYCAGSFRTKEDIGTYCYSTYCAFLKSMHDALCQLDERHFVRSISI